MSAQFLTAQYAQWNIEAPALHIVLGSGLSSAFDQIDVASEWKEIASLKFSEVPSLPKASVQGHPGAFKYFQHLKTKRVICFQAGRLHGYEGHSPREVVNPLLLAFQAGTKRFLLSNAAGSINPSFLPGSVMIINDQVNMTGTNPLYGPNPVGENGKPLGPRFPDMSSVYDVSMRQSLRQVCEGRGLTVHEGLYMGLSGPAFETPAEVRLYGQWGIGAVGMSTVWEAIALKHAGATLAGLSVISNLGCGLSDQPLSHAEVEEIGRQIGKQLLETLFDFSRSYV